VRPKVFVTRKITQEALGIIAQECDVEVFPEERPITKEELRTAVKDKDGILVLVTDEVDGEVIEAGNKLKIIANYGEGYNHVNITVASERGIWVTNTPSPDIATAVAEATIGLILTVSKRIVEADKFMRTGKFKGWGPTDWIGQELAHKMLGIIGMGRIGREVAERMRGWNMNICYYDKAGRMDWGEEKRFGAIYVYLETVLRESDFISIHVPLNRTTHHLIGEKELSLMKPTAFLINTSRGGVIDERALVKALKEKKIAGAALDVLEFEPKITRGLKKMKNVVITPHLAGATESARVKPAILAARNLVAGVMGKPPLNPVNLIDIKTDIKNSSD